MNELERLKEKIPAVFKDAFPKNYENRVQHFGFYSRKEIEENKGKLLMLDLDFGIKCSLNCPYCFRKDNKVDELSKEMLSFGEVIKVVKDAKKLGLNTVKLCGAGERLENKQLLPFLEELTAMDVGVGILCKGHVLGDDKLSKKYFGDNGIKNARQLCEKLHSLKTGIYLGFTSYNSTTQNKLVGNVEWYSTKRNKALLNLVKAGFNKESPTRMALAINPITKQNYETVFESYVFARERNFYPIVSLLMPTGRARNPKLLKEIDITEKQKMKLFERIYSYNIKKGIQSIEQIREEGLSSMPGGHPCNQIASGMYVTLNGSVLICPGYENQVLGNVRDQHVKEIWEKSENFKRRGTFNCYCPPKDGKTIPYNLYSRVLKRLEEKYS